MRAIWGLTQRWAQYGNLNGPIDTDAVQREPMNEVPVTLRSETLALDA